MIWASGISLPYFQKPFFGFWPLLSVRRCCLACFRIYGEIMFLKVKTGNYIITITIKQTKKTRVLKVWNCEDHCFLIYKSCLLYRTFLRWFGLPYNMCFMIFLKTKLFKIIFLYF
jgi:hypothetical protein